MFLKSIGVGLDRFGAAWRRFWGEFWRFLPFWAMFGPFGSFWAILGSEAPGEPQISMEEGRFNARMVRESPNNGFDVDWSRQLQAVLGEFWQKQHKKE